MPTEIHSCLIVSCDVCDAPLDSQFDQHFSTRLRARRDARAQGWTVLDDNFVCARSDTHHETARRALRLNPTYYPTYPGTTTPRMAG